MTREEIIEQFKELRHLVKDMDVPDFRKGDPHWLNKNLGARNSKHTNYKSAMETIEALLKSGARSEPQ